MRKRGEKKRILRGHVGSRRGKRLRRSRAARSSGWNELVPQDHRFESPNKGRRRPASLRPTHIVIHITGTKSFTTVKKTFLKPHSVSAHYLITPSGELFQFVQDTERAWHAGIDSNTERLYRQGFAAWSRYLKYFPWYRAYPNDAVYVDGDLNPVWDKTEAVFVATNDGTTWQHFDYFEQRWPDMEIPVNFDVDTDPNNYSIGIELLSVGAKTKNRTAYTDKMYKTLARLIQNLSDKYEIPQTKGRIVGHEDVNPIGRFGWDPNSGFDWTRVYTD